MSSARFGLIALLALVAGVYWSCTKDEKTVGPSPQPPDPPSGLYDVQTSPTAITLRWNYSSTGIQGFRIYMSQDSADVASFVKVDSTGASARQAMEDSLSPGVRYFFYVTAYNADGESVPSNIRGAQTTTIPLPTPPRLISATVLVGDTVELLWARTGVQDYFVVQRHDSGVSGWTTLDSTVWGEANQYRDVAVTPGAHYYYRVGSKNVTATVFSADSLSAIIPVTGAPYPPANLQAEVHLETQTIVLTWTNISTDADSIIVGRNSMGAPLDTIAVIPGNATTYTDSVGPVYGTYGYRLKAVSIAHGASPWSQPVEVHYRLCSDGVIPLCVGNYWIYAVTDTVGPSFNARRDVFYATFFNGQDYYLIGNSQRGATDSLYYLRNDSTLQGALMLHWPLLQSDNPQLLFKYPATQVADSYHVDGHLVEIVTALPGIDKTVSNVTYHGVIAYDWFLASNHWIRVWVKPLDVGIIMEEEFTGNISNPDKRATRSLVSYHVSNQP